MATELGKQIEDAIHALVEVAFKQGYEAGRDDTWTCVQKLHSPAVGCTGRGSMFGDTPWYLCPVDEVMARVEEYEEKTMNKSCTTCEFATCFPTDGTPCYKCRNRSHYKPTRVC